jgi:hypothetical protein
VRFSDQMGNDAASLAQLVAQNAFVPRFLELAIQYLDDVRQSDERLLNFVDNVIEHWC